MRRPELNGRLVQCIEQLAPDEAGRRHWKSEILGNDPGQRREIITIRPENVRPVPPSEAVRIPVACSVGIDGHGSKGVRVMYSDFMGLEGLLPTIKRFFPGNDPAAEGLLEEMTKQMYGIATSPYGGPLGDQECVVARSKHEALYNVLTSYQCLRDTGRTAVVGMHRDVRVCEILFPYDIEETIQNS